MSSRRVQRRRPLRSSSWGFLFDAGLFIHLLTSWSSAISPTTPQSPPLCSRVQAPLLEEGEAEGPGPAQPVLQGKAWIKWNS